MDERGATIVQDDQLAVRERPPMSSHHSFSVIQGKISKRSERRSMESARHKLKQIRTRFASASKGTRNDRGSDVAEKTIERA